ncbi:MAG: C/D box methylation guide ribonucleoprotein complex aNOP56 subunit [Candidatus Helarchaeota archaeon]
MVETPFGIFGLDEENKIITKRLFENNVEVVANKLEKLQSSNLIPELKEIIADLQENDYNQIVLEDNELVRILKYENIFAESPNPASRTLRSKLIPFIKEFGVWKSDSEISSFIQQINIQVTRQRIKQISEQKDQFIAQAIEAVDDCDKALNVFVSRIREWFGLHFPELDKRLSSHTSYAKIVAKLGNRTEISRENLMNLIGFPQEKAQEIAQLAKKSMGGAITDFELAPLQEFASITEQLYRNRELLATYVDEAMVQVAPNLRALAGSLLGARLISLAGGLERLARFPSSTIQVLGAEKALFRSLKTGAKPPKHGIIFQWEDIHGAPFWLKGKIARALAGKLSIAARVDFYSGEYIGDNLLLDLKHRLDDIRKKYPKAPRKKTEKKAEGTKKRTPRKKSKQYYKYRKKNKKKYHKR